MKIRSRMVTTIIILLAIALTTSFAIPFSLQAQSSCDLTTVDAFNTRGDESYSAGDYQSAVDDYTCALALDPNNVYALVSRGNAYGILYPADAQPAIDDYTKALEYETGVQDYLYFDRGSTYLGMKQYDLAEADLNKAIEITPTYSGAYNNRGNIYYEQGDYTRAIADYDQAIELKDSELYIPYYNRGIANYELGNYVKSIDDLNQAIVVNPSYDIAYLARGGTYQIVDPTKSHADFLKWIDLIQTDSIDQGSVTGLDEESLSMTQGRVYRYTFTGSTGQVLNAVARADENSTLDPLLVLLGPDDQPIASDDDSGVNIDAVIAGYSLPSDGLYTLVVSHAGFGSEGDLKLTLTLDGEASKIFEVYSLEVNQPARVYTTEGDRLNLRSGPGLNFDIVGKLDKETTVTLLEGPRKANGLAWWRVQTADGQEGWAVERVETEQTLQPPLVINNLATVFPLSGDKLNVRQNPGRVNDIVVQLEPGVVVTLIDGPQEADGLRWWKIRTPDGQEGWAVDEVDGEQTIIGKAASAQ
ncbi:MAG TPA: tetratricopeptide repeat protein [Phototrophicaceae bacterium]|nr:tetratricopeptide repeat protein [Phototrophicaceae bacterium]